MGNQFKFWWRCVQHAWRDSWALAHKLACVLGRILLAAIVWASWHYLTAKGWVQAPATFEGGKILDAVSAVTSLALVLVLIFVTRLSLAPARLYWVEHTRAEELYKDLQRARGKGQAATGLNWPIHELFSYLEPNVLDEPDKALWEDASLKIRDTASLGQLRIWGRLFKTDLGHWVGERASLREIDKTYRPEGILHICFSMRPQPAIRWPTATPTGYAKSISA